MTQTHNHWVTTGSPILGRQVVGSRVVEAVAHHLTTADNNSTIGLLVRMSIRNFGSPTPTRLSEDIPC